jgi:hypothetical protein
MSPQADFVVANGTGAAVRSDINNQLAAIVSNNSGATEPATMYAYQWWADTTTGLLKLRNAANNAWITLFQLDGEWSTLAVENGSASAPSIYFKDSGTDTGIYSPGTDQVAISTGGTGRLFVNASGNVGLGTSSPGRNLDIVSSDTWIRTARTSGNAWIIGPGVQDAFRIYDDTAGAERFRIEATTGRVGIGTTTPSNALEVSGSFRTFSAANGDVSITHSGLVSTLQAAGSIALAFGSNNAERGRFDTSGRFLVGTSSVSDAQVGIASGNGWVYRTYSFGSGGSRTVTVVASFNYWVEITLTMTSNNEIAQARTILGRRDINPHRSATANIVGSAITQTITSSDSGNTRTWTIVYNNSGDDGNKHYMFEVKSLATESLSVT